MQAEMPAGSRSGGRALALLMWMIPVALIAMGVRHWQPPLASEHGAGIDRMLRYLMWTVGSMLIAGHLVLGYFIWRFSGQSRVTLRLFSRKAERRLSLIPVILMTLTAEGGVFALGLPVWQKFYGAAPDNTMLVEVTGEQFAWNVRYAGADNRLGHTDPRLISDDNPLGVDPKDPASGDDIVGLGVLRLPVGRPVRIQLRSKDVLHSFNIPSLRVKQDAVPGMTIEIWFVPTRVGNYEIACSQLCGFGHFQMRGVVAVLPQEEFDNWKASATTFGALQ